MKRRLLLLGGGAWLAVVPLVPLSQSERRPRLIEYVHPGTRAGNQYLFDILRADLKSLGYSEGRDVVIHPAWADDRTDRMPSLAAEAVARKPDLIVTATGAGVAAFKKATSTIPVVFTTAGNPEEQGFVASLQRPGGNITGIMLHLGLTSKSVEIAREAFPKATRLAILVHETDPVHRLYLDAFLPSAKRLGFEPVVLRVAKAEDLDRAFRELAISKAALLYVPDQAFMLSRRKRLAAQSLAAKTALFSNTHEITGEGGLMSYGTPREENYRRAAMLVDKILRGAKPGDLPIEQPERFLLVVNRKTAQAIGVTLSPATMQRVDRVID